MEESDPPNPGSSLGATIAEERTTTSGTAHCCRLDPVLEEEGATSADVVVDEDNVLGDNPRRSLREDTTPRVEDSLSSDRGKPGHLVNGSSIPERPAT